MAWGESKAWKKGNAKRKKIIRPEDMPWEMARQGLLKHLLNEQMNTRMETVDAYMQIIPPGSRSGKHRHLAEECLDDLEQVEDAPEYAPSVKLDAELMKRYLAGKVKEPA